MMIIIMMHEKNCVHDVEIFGANKKKIGIFFLSNFSISIFRSTKCMVIIIIFFHDDDDDSIFFIFKKIFLTIISPSS